MRHFIFPLPRYIIFVLISMGSSLAIGCYIIFRNNLTINYATWLWSFIAIVFALVIMPLVIIRLPIFRDFYHRDVLNFNHRRHGAMRNQQSKAAAALASLIVGLLIFTPLYLFGASNAIIPVACGAITAGIMSFYYDY